MSKPHFRTALLLLAASAASVASEAAPEAAALQKDIISDIGQLTAIAPKNVPNLLEAAMASGFRQLPVGTMVTRKFASVEELKKTGPVKQVKGKLMGGPFTMAQAVRAAGMALIKKIFPRSVATDAEKEGPGPPQASTRAPGSYKSLGKSTGPPPKTDSLLVGKLMASLNSKEEFNSKWKQKLDPKSVGEAKGKVIAKDKDIKRSSYVKTPAKVLATLDYTPKIIDGHILAGDISGIETLTEEQVQAKIKGARP